MRNITKRLAFIQIYHLADASGANIIRRALIGLSYQMAYLPPGEPIRTKCLKREIYEA